MNRNSGQCLTFVDAKPPQASVVQSPAASVANQTWRVAAAPDGFRRFVHPGTGQALAVRFANRNAGEVLEQQAVGPQAEQQWSFETLPDRVVRIANRNSGLYLSVADESRHPLARVFQWRWGNGDEQKWTFEPADEAGNPRADALSGARAIGLEVRNVADGITLRGEGLVESRA